MSQRPTPNSDRAKRPEPATSDPLGPPGIRAALHRKALADARQRAALARHIGLTDTEVLAIHHLARAGQLTPGQLRDLLQLSSGGTTGVIRRLQHAGHITRRPHLNDARSAVLRLTPEIATLLSEAWAPYVAEIDAHVSALSDRDRDLIERFLQRAANAAERHADRLAHEADATAHDALAVPLPALWA